MSLLTEEQIEQLVGLASNQSTSKDLFDTFQEWNEKQTGVQVKVNWELAPKETTSVDIRAYWRGTAFSLGAVFANIPRPTTPHPHAEIIAKYAEVAARRCDPWVEFEIEFSGNWVICDCEIRFLNDGRKYRHIGDKVDPMTARKGDDKPWNLSRDD